MLILYKITNLLFLPFLHQIPCRDASFQITETDTREFILNLIYYVLPEIPGVYEIQDLSSNSFTKFYPEIIVVYEMHEYSMKEL